MKRVFDSIAGLRADVSASIVARRGTRLLTGLLACLLGASIPSGELAAQSQTTSAIRGIVLRVDDTPLTEATVTVRHTRTGVEKSVITNIAGRFLLLLLQPGGPYEISASHLGYSDLTVEGI